MMRRIGFNKSITRGFSTAENATTSKITIQPAIKRSATDLLKALSETVGVDKTAPHFAFIDDPITIPSTESAKRTYFMAKELGKRAARELASEWPTLFAFDRDQPRLPAFRPTNLPDPLQVDPTEKNLEKMIQSREVEDSCILYERMRSENIEVNERLQLELFKLVSYYNSSKIPFAEWAEWPGIRNFGENENSGWKNGAVADLLFETLPKTDETVSIFISGLCKFPNDESIAKAKQVYKEHRTSGGKIKREAFNGLIKISNFSAAKKLCLEMAKLEIKPDVNTFNAILTSASKIGNFNERSQTFSQIIGEMKSMNIEPALSSYYIVFKYFIDYKLLGENKENSEDERNYKKELTLAVTWLNEVLENIEGKTLEVASKSCNLFFAEAMGIAYRSANLKVGQKILEIYESKNNNVKMPAFTTESTFYNRYLQLFIEQSTSIEQIHEIYKSFVPRLVGVTNSLSKAVYEKLSRQKNWALLRRVIEDGIAAGQVTTMIGEDMRRHLIDTQFHTLSVAERDEYKDLVQKLVSTWIEFSQFTEENTKRRQRKLLPSQISDCALLLTRIGENQKAFELLELLLDEEATHGETATVMARGYPRPSSIAELFEESLRRKDQDGAAICLQIMGLNNNRSKLEPLANRLIEKCNLSESQQKIINSFVRLRPQ